jgi:tetratricopeptide (TPR) repeat protein
VKRGAIAKALRLWQFFPMKAFWFAVILLAGFAIAGHAQSQADERYIGIYGLMQRADQLAQTGEPGEALAAYTDAQQQLAQFQRVYPNWNPNIVSFRLNQLAGKIDDLKPRIPPSQQRPPPANIATKPVAPAPPVVSGQTPVAPVETPEAATNPSQSSSDLEELRAALQSEREANRQLQAKLKEALASQPATVDARELSRAQEKIRWLMKQNDLLLSTRQAPVAPKVQTIVMTNFVKVLVTNSGPVEVSNLADAFKKDSQPVVVTNVVSTVVVDTNAMEMLRLEHAATVRNYNEEHDRAEQLANQLQKIQQLAKTASAAPTATTATNNNDAEMATLRSENASLKNQLQHLLSVTSSAAAAATTASASETLAELKQARAQIAALKSENEVLALEKLALQGRLQALVSATNANVNVAAYETRIRELALERNDLIERLDTANKQKSGKNNETLAQLSSLNQEVTVLRSRLSVAEAQPAPFTAEELALFKKTTPAPVNPDAGKKSIKEMPAGTAELVVSASRHFAQQEFDQAEADYLKILERDQNNGIALANLATIEMQQGKLDDAEKHAKAALAASPDDAYNLSTMGYLKFRQEKYDDALNYLSRAAQIDSSNPEIQNYLGLTLSQLGQRKPAEAALRRAIQLAPNYAPAHNNLAVIYISQQPPLPELARWHYQKALEAGQPRNPDLEKALADKGAPVQ